MAVDIGELIFVGILQMTQYPGSPFTGNLFRDIIMFLIVPTIFIILVVFMMVSRILPADEYPRLRTLLAVGSYLFIIAGGFYPAFAYLAGPYFIVLIFILGLLFFFLEHFHTKEPPGAARAGGNYPAAIPKAFSHSKHDREQYKIEQRMREIMQENPGGNYPEEMLYNMAKREVDYEKKHGFRR